MKIVRLSIGVAIALSVACIGYFSGGQVGFSYDRNGGKIVVSAATHPVLLLWAAAAVCVYWALMRREIHTERAGHVGLTRRFFAFLMDLYLVALIFGGILALIPLWFEARRTGHFEWQFERDYSVSTDFFVFFSLSLTGVLVLFFYYAYPLMRGKQTVGSFVLRMKACPASKTDRGLTFSLACKRISWASLGSGLWPYTLWKRLDKNGRTWYDRVSNFDVTLVDYK